MAFALFRLQFVNVVKVYQYVIRLLTGKIWRFFRRYVGIGLSLGVLTY